MALWQLIRRDHPADTEAAHKLKDLAANDTIARGGYEGVVGPDGEGAPRAVRREPPADPGGARGPGTDPGRKSSPDQRIAREAAALRARIEADPAGVHGYLQLAALYRRSDLLAQAREILTEGLKATDNAFELQLELADLDIEPFRQNLALTEEKLKAQPEDEELRRIRIRLRKEVNTRELEYFRQKAERFPTEMVHRFEVGVRLLRAGQYDEAIQELQASRSDPRHRWQAMLYLGHCFKARNNARLAQRNFEDALQNLPGSETATRKELLFLLAQGHAEAGDLARAVDVAHELANLDFSYRDIGRLLDEWQTKLQQERISR
jgi:tetratricopeptide (TPR) repeat protein